MPAFEYRALDLVRGKEVKGVIDSENAKQARQLLRQQQLSPLQLVESGGERPSKSDKPADSAARFRGSISIAEQALLTRQLATLISSGTSVERALMAVSRQSPNNRLKTLLLAVRSNILEGRDLATSMSLYPKAFSRIYHSTVRAGEQAGHLPEVLERLADYAEERQQFHREVKNALFYPVFLVIFAVTIVGLLLTYVVPKVVRVYEDLGQDLPFLTQAMISISAFLQDNGLWLLIAIAIAIVGGRKLLEIEAVDYRLGKIKLVIPLIATLTRSFNTSQLSRTMSILASSGVPVLQSLTIAAEVIPNAPMREAVTEASIKVREGRTLSRSLEKSGFFPPMLIQLIASGEASGRIDQMLEKAAVHQEREMKAILDNFLGIFAPLIIILMGGMVMVIVLAILLPIFQLNSLVTG